jgi:cobalt/nickel transport system permease protein
MHMADALLSPAVGAAFWAGTVGAIAYSARELKENPDEKLVPLMGVLGAFIFAAQMINFTIPGTGSSGHLGGGMILAIILGPYAAFIVMASVLTVQALFFADGGLLALGCNIWNLGIYPCFIAYPFIYRPLVRAAGTPRRIAVAALLSGVVALQLGAFSVVIETLLSARSELPFGAFALVMQPIHLGIGLIEGLATAGVINFFRVARPEILDSVISAQPLPAEASLRRVLSGLLLFALLTGGMLSWFASSDPDGLEWSIEKVLDKPSLPEEESGIAHALKKIQEKTSFLPEYGFRKAEEAPEKAGVEQSNGTGKGGKIRHAIATGTSLAGVLGSALVLGLIFLLGFAIRVARKNKSSENMTGHDIR